MVVNKMCRKVFIKPPVHDLLKNVESEIKEIVGTDIYSFTREHSKYDEKYEKIKELLYLADLGIESKIINAEVEGNIFKVLENEEVKGTIISRGN